ncbi:beta-lactamase [Cucurbitaria berberidis CBS 394.84]|uniref:Beta-lactamase n=1 Tax=Cucurbitaria berberidis CBS 394.84 TaxID=1168544 RepID=A0A9P4GIS9_9PLEO|nr:beta-lactamase [Cucurbitaria berberidis CBS 394.84]KAF1846072.1 beta-lactamase [Cucurbitaria berberidis CBS 394.84]
MAKVQGTAEDRFKEVEKLFQSNLDEGAELGASIAVNIDGKDVVDLWGGYAKPDHSQPWEKDTIVNVWSTSKNVTSLAALVCIDRGLLDPYEKVSKYWPEFAANGKENVEIRHLLSHASGVSGWVEPVTGADVCDVGKSTAMLAAQAPWWEPGTASGYHSLTMGHLIGEVVRRVSGKSLSQFIIEELATPLNADFQLGAKDEDLGRVAEIVPPPPMDPATIPDSFKDPTSIAFKSLMNPSMDASRANTEVWRKGEVGAANGHTNARGIVHILSPISLGGGNLLSPKTIDLIFKEQSNAPDLVLGQTIRFGIGFGLSGPNSLLDWLPEGRVCAWGGWGGSIVIMDLERKVTIAYMMNKMETAVMGSERSRAYVRAIYKALGVE